MGLQLQQPPGVNSPPPAGDQANQYLAGTFSAVGVSNAVCFWGPFNLALYASSVISLATTAGSTAATATGVTAGWSINSVNVPAGTTAKAVSGTNVTLSSAATVTGTDANAVFTGAGITFNATVQLEKTYDGGKTFIPHSISNGTLAQWTGASVAPVSLMFQECEKGVGYRLNATAYTSGTINYRLSTTGGAAMSLANAAAVG